MAKKEGKTRLFENDVTITGKHATHLKFLVNDAKLYNDYIDVYMNAAVFGYMYSKKNERDNESTDRARIYADAFSNHRTECVFLFRLITLLDDENITTEERLDRAFRYDANPEKEEELQKCIDTFNAYVRGGIEYMYNLFTTGCTSKDDYIRATFEATRNYKDRIDGVSYEDKIKRLLNRA